MIDRLRDLKGRNPGVPALNQSLSDNTILEGKELLPHQEGIEQKFFQKIKTAKIYIQRISVNTEQIETLRQMFYKAIKTTQEKQATGQLEQLTKSNKEIHSKLKTLLESIKQEVEDCESNEQLKEEPETRMMRNLYNNIANEMIKMLKEESVAEEMFKTSMRTKLGRQVKIINKNLSDEEVEDYVNHPQKAQEMLQQKIYGQASHNLRNAVSDIQDKFRDIQRLEQCVSECLQLFKQLSEMIYRQGQLIDNIELNCMDAKNYVQKADKNLVKAKEHHQCTKKCMCILMIIGIIVLLVVLVPIIVTFTKK